MDDPDFKQWLGETIGIICQETVDLSGDIGDSMKNVMSAVGNGVKGETPRLKKNWSVIEVFPEWLDE